jgi:hypothetical protein
MAVRVGVDVKILQSFIQIGQTPSISVRIGRLVSDKHVLVLVVGLLLDHRRHCVLRETLPDGRIATPDLSSVHFNFLLRLMLMNFLLQFLNSNGVVF